MTIDPPRGQALPRTVLVIAYVLVLLATLIAGVGVLMANVMACDAGGEGCVDRAMWATGVWGVVTYGVPLAALVWGLVSRATTRAGRRNRILALIVMIAGPVLAFGINLLILFPPRAS